MQIQWPSLNTKSSHHRPWPFASGPLTPLALSNISLAHPFKRRSNLFSQEQFSTAKTNMPLACAYSAPACVIKRSKGPSSTLPYSAKSTNHLKRWFWPWSPNSRLSMANPCKSHPRASGKVDNFPQATFSPKGRNSMRVAVRPSPSWTPPSDLCSTSSQG